MGRREGSAVVTGCRHLSNIFVNVLRVVFWIWTFTMIGVMLMPSSG